MTDLSPRLAALSAEQRARVTQALAEQRWNEFLAALREQADVVDGRQELNRRLAAQPPIN